MPKLIVLYPRPVDAAIFERRYSLEHVPMVYEKIPGLKKFVAARVLGTPTGAAPYERVAELYFDSADSLQSARWRRPEDKRLLLTPWRFRLAVHQ